ncbi:MAG: LytR C-terminal domain-containing protein [Gaiellaceae bacterium]
MAAASSLERPHPPKADESPLARARVHRQLTTEEAARRAGISEDEARWLEEGRVYRFPSSDHALLAVLLYASGLGIDHREALGLAGRPVPPRLFRGNVWARLAVLVALAAALASLAAAVTLGRGHEGQPLASPPARSLPARWTVKIVVLNGSGDINYTRRLASRIGALGYEIVHVGRASRFDYAATIVYFPPGGGTLAARLAKTLGASTAPLPGGDDPRRLVVIAGPARGPG